MKTEAAKTQAHSETLRQKEQPLVQAVNDEMRSGGSTLLIAEEGNTLQSARSVTDQARFAAVQDKVFRRLVEAASPIEEDGGTEEQREAFSEAFQDACWVLTCLDDEQVSVDEVEELEVDQTRAEGREI